MNIQLNFWLYWFIFCGIILSGYFLSASGIYWLLYSRHERQIFNILPLAQQLQAQALTERDSITIVADIKRSVISVICFALGAAVFMDFYNWGLTKVYLDFGANNAAYLILSYGLVLLLQDTFFYFTHRLFHSPSLFKWFHQGHHLSKPPTPWTFFALDPFEAISQIFFLFLVTLVVPLHISVLLAILLTMTTWSIGNHLGFQIIPTSRFSCWWGRWCIGSTHHLVHHQRYNRHFGLYFTFWDKLLNTEDSGYEADRQMASS